MHRKEPLKATEYVPQECLRLILGEIEAEHNN